MLSLEEYLSQRKKDEGIVDRDRTAKYKNAKKCMGFVLDYYTEYLDTVPQDNMTALQFDKH